MGTQYLIDTNAVIEFLAGELPDSGSSWLQNLLDKNAVHLSVINQIELLGFNGDPSEMQILEAFVETYDVVPLENIVVKKTIELRKKHKIKLPDIIIAATALTHNLILITRNLKDFHKIESLVCIDAHKQ